MSRGTSWRRVDPRPLVRPLTSSEYELQVLTLFRQNLRRLIQVNLWPSALFALSLVVCFDVAAPLLTTTGFQNDPSLALLEFLAAAAAIVIFGLALLPSAMLNGVGRAARITRNTVLNQDLPLNAPYHKHGYRAIRGRLGLLLLASSTIVAINSRQDDGGPFGGTLIFFSVVLVIIALFVLVPSLPIHCAEAALDPTATDQQIKQRMAQHGAQPSSVSLLSALYFKLILVLSFLLIGFIALLSILLQILNSGAWSRWATLTLSISATTLILWGVFLILFSLFGVVGGVAWVERRARFEVLDVRLWVEDLRTRGPRIRPLR